jgi:hypothetical protein
MGEFKKFFKNCGTFFWVLLSNITRAKTFRKEMVKKYN